MSAYRRLLRPLLFKLPAETSHELAVFALGLPLPWPTIGRVPADPRLETDLCGLRLSNPVGLAAGFDKNCRVLSNLGQIGFGYLVAGTVTAEPWAGNARPRISRYPERESLVNAMGLPNAGARVAAGRMGRLERTAPSLVSIGGHSEADFLAAFESIEPVADGVELNISCPNIRWGRDTNNEALLAAVLPRLRSATQKPIIVKIPPYGTPVERDAILTLVKIARQGGADGLTAFNTVPITAAEMSIGTGGLSGRAITENTRRLVADLFHETDGSLPINACGGIFSAADAIACIRAGASTVQVYTGFIYRGPSIVGDITRGLLEQLDNSPTRLKDLIGASA